VAYAQRENPVDCSLGAVVCRTVVKYDGYGNGLLCCSSRRGQNGHERTRKKNAVWGNQAGSVPASATFFNRSALANRARGRHRLTDVQPPGAL